ncbi:MAG: hypothetical protein DMF78_21175 [Acidobacteria bacterium]|nr:MAG: hypothetical protein DMF78_21175 [Acidobacteriota bacterium]
MVLGLVGLLGAAVPACRPGRAPIRNVLLISIDTLRADHLGSYGFPRATTPHIEARSRPGTACATTSTSAFPTRA